MGAVDEGPSQDEVFVAQYLENEDKPDAAIIAARLARFTHLGQHPRVTAEYHLSRPEIQLAINAARKARKKPQRLTGEPTIDAIYADCDVAIELALNTNNPSGAVAGIKLKAQVAGLLKENVVHTHRLDVTALTDDQLMAIAARKPKMIEGTFTDVTPSPQGLGALVSPEGN